MRNRGFSLIELMITVAILGIIVSVALPSYTSYVTRGKRTECRTAIMQVMQQQERYFTQQNAYLAFAYTTSNVPMKTLSGDSLANSACTISANVCSGTAVAVVAGGSPNATGCTTVTAAPYGRTDADVGDITLQSDGTKGCSGTDQTKCWKS